MQWSYKNATKTSRKGKENQLTGLVLQKGNIGVKEINNK
jgi:hypothetical protein